MGIIDTSSRQELIVPSVFIPDFLDPGARVLISGSFVRLETLRDAHYERPGGPQGKHSLSVGVGAGPMTASAAEFFQMLKMELRLDSTAHSCLLFYKNKRGLTGSSAITRPNCALGDDRVREGIGWKRFKIYLSGFPLDFFF